LGWLGWAVGRLIRFGVKLGVFALVLLTLYGAFLVKRLDVSRESLQARARSVEANIVPSRVAGPGGHYFDTALEIPLSLPAERIPPFVRDAFITREDQQFGWHPGFNPVSLGRAFLTNAKRSGDESGGLVGGSTITMQLVKNLLLTQEQTLDRKVNEIILAVVVELLFSKDEILAMYLNTAYFGAGAYGVEVAARRFFGRSVGYAPKVNMLEAAMLAHSVRRPSQLNPLSQPKVLAEKARALIGEMKKQGYTITEGAEARPRGDRKWSLDPFLFRDVAMRSLVPPEVQARKDRVVMGFTIDTEAQLYAELAAGSVDFGVRPLSHSRSAYVSVDGAPCAFQ